MRLVIDNNVFFSLMNPKSINSYLFSMLRINEYFVPKCVNTELNEHKADCLVKSQLSEHEFELRRMEVEDELEFTDLPEYKRFLKKAIGSLPDPEDSPYLALALRLNCPIWSNDKHFEKQSLVKVFKTEDLVKLLLNNKF